jgi:hypothetical protein
MAQRDERDLTSEVRLRRRSTPYDFDATSRSAPVSPQRLATDYLGRLELVAGGRFDASSLAWLLQARYPIKEGRSCTASYDAAANIKLMSRPL